MAIWTHKMSPLAILPLHGTSILVLTDSLVGESGTMHLFYFDREQVTSPRCGKWVWSTSAKPLTP